MFTKLLPDIRPQERRATFQHSVQRIDSDARFHIVFVVTIDTELCENWFDLRVKAFCDRGVDFISKDKRRYADECEKADAGDETDQWAFRHGKSAIGKPMRSVYCSLR